MGSGLRFELYQGDTMGLTSNDNYVIFRWMEPDCKVIVSMCQRGQAANCHFASDKAGLRKMKRAIDEFCQFVFCSFDWSTMIMAIIERPSVVRLVEKCGFNYITNIEDKKVYTRLRKWAEQ